MADPKEPVTSAIARAQAALDQALTELEKMPVLDAGSVGFAAHALNNYLTVTSGLVELVLMRLPEEADAQLRGWLQGAQHAAHLMSRLTRQLTRASEPAKHAFRHESFDLPTLARRACSFYEGMAGRKDVHVEVAPAAGVPPAAGDRVAVAAVLDNLVSNAIKFSPPGGAVRVEVRGEGEWVVCAVRDRGPGLSPEDQASLFQRGARLTPQPTAGEPSTGFGLAVAKELVEGLGGQIWCESTPGQGSCFAFRLPVSRETPPGP